jgi:hypothetical protein
VATATASRNVILWDPKTGERLRQLVPNFIDGPDLHSALSFARTAPAFSPDGRFVATAGERRGTLAVQEMGTGAVRRVLATDQRGVSGLAFSPDSRLLASVSMDGTALLWDLTAPAPGDAAAAELTDKDLAALWGDLGGRDGAKVDRAVVRLAADPKRSVPFLRDNVKRAESAEDEKVLAKLIADLDSDDFETRKRAQEELGNRGARVKPALLRALEGKPSLDVRKRLEALLGELDSSPQGPWDARLLRGVEVLERIGTAEARQALEALAGGPAHHPLTEDARAAAGRLSRPAKP